MIVHLVGSLRDIETDSRYIQCITDAIHDHGGVLAHNWLEAALVRKKEGVAIADWTPLVKNDLDAIKRADVVIADLTHYAFSHGFQIAAALEQRKPVLALTRDSIKSKSASGVADILFTHKQYTNEQELRSHTEEFLKKNTVHTKDLRFNILLTPHIFSYLEELSNETGKNKSEIIRELIRQKAKKGF